LGWLDRMPSGFITLKALQHFVEQQAGAPEKIREALLQGDLAGAERMVQSFKKSGRRHWGDGGAKQPADHIERLSRCGIKGHFLDSSEWSNIFNCELI
jgi:uncharacterized membrane protein YccC